MNPMFPSYIFPTPFWARRDWERQRHASASVICCSLKQRPSLPLSSVVPCTLENPITCPKLPGGTSSILLAPRPPPWPQISKAHAFPHDTCSSNLSEPHLPNKHGCPFSLDCAHEITTITWDRLGNPTAHTVYPQPNDGVQAQVLIHTFLRYLLHLLISIDNPMHMQPWNRRPITCTFLRHVEQISTQLLCLPASRQYFPKITGCIIPIAQTSTNSTETTSSSTPTN